MSTPDRSDGPHRHAERAAPRRVVDLDHRASKAAAVVRGLTVELPVQRRPYGAPLRAVHDLSFEVPTGEVTVMVGRNGAGKTTVLRALSGALPASGGSMEVLGADMRPATRRLPLGAALVPDSPNYPARWSSRQIARAHELTTPSFDRSLFEDRLRRCGVSPGRACGRLSQGQLTQVSISAALAQDPHLLILDEPFAHLDPLARAQLVDELREVMTHEGRSILLSTHDLEGMERFVDHLVMIAGGRAVLEGEVEQLLDDAVLLERSGPAGRPPEGRPVQLIGAVRTGELERGLLPVDEAVLLGESASLRRPGLPDLVTHWLRESGGASTTDDRRET